MARRGTEAQAAGQAGRGVRETGWDAASGRYRWDGGEIDAFDRIGGPHDSILGEEGLHRWADDADEEKRKAGLVPEGPDPFEVAGNLRGIQSSKFNDGVVTSLEGRQMAIPDYQTLMLPVLKASAKGEVRIADVVAQVSKEFGLTPDDVATMLPSGKQTIVSNRTHWAKAYLAKAGLVEATRRGCFRITTRGLTVLTENPKRIDVPYLMKYEEFRKFREGGCEGKVAVQFSALIPTAVDADSHGMI